MRWRDVRVLVLFIWVMCSDASFSCKRELCHNVADFCLLWESVIGCLCIRIRTLTWHRNLLLWNCDRLFINLVFYVLRWRHRLLHSFALNLLPLALFWRERVLLVASRTCRSWRYFSIILNWAWSGLLLICWLGLYVGLRWIKDWYWWLFSLLLSVLWVVTFFGTSWFATIKSLMLLNQWLQLLRNCLLCVLRTTTHEHRLKCWLLNRFNSDWGMVRHLASDPGVPDVFECFVVRDAS